MLDFTEEEIVKMPQEIFNRSNVMIEQRQVRAMLEHLRTTQPVGDNSWYDMYWSSHAEVGRLRQQLAESSNPLTAEQREKVLDSMCKITWDWNEVRAGKDRLLTALEQLCNVSAKGGMMAHFKPTQSVASEGDVERVARALCARTSDAPCHLLCLLCTRDAKAAIAAYNSKPDGEGKL